MAKYGMSLCVLGMAEEFRSIGIAVNALWPRTTIDTEAIRLIAGQDARMKARSPQIMADAAYWILTQPARTITGDAQEIDCRHESIKRLVLRAEFVRKR